MSDKVKARKVALRDTLIALAEDEIRSGGLGALRARSLAQSAGCSVGAIYNVFDDLNGVVLAVNGRTFQKLGAFVTDAVAANEDASPGAQLVTMGTAYLNFAVANMNLWRALFDVEMSADGPVPDWYVAALGGLFAIIAKPLAQMHPDMDRTELDLLTRALFSSVHGIVLLGLERRISAVPPDHIEAMIVRVLSQFTGT